MRRAEGIRELQAKRRRVTALVTDVNEVGPASDERLAVGLDHLRFTHRYQGRDFRLTDVGGKVIREWLA